MNKLYIVTLKLSISIKSILTNTLPLVDVGFTVYSVFLCLIFLLNHFDSGCFLK